MNTDLLKILPERYDAVILAAGEFPTSAMPIRILKHAERLFVCDGALPELLELGIVPTAVVGDGDSLSPTLKEQFKAVYHEIDEQEDNDLTKTTRHAMAVCAAQKPYGEPISICYVGASGKREDHTLANIALMMRYFEDFGVLPTMVTDYGWFSACKGNASFDSFPGQQVSIFNFSCSALSSSGLRWNAYPFNQLWQGTLNESLGNTFQIEANGAYLVYRTYQPKN